MESTPLLIIEGLAMNANEPQAEPLIGQSRSNYEGLGTPLYEECDVKRLRDDVDFLWSLLDDIDTASDIAKEDDKLYRQIVEIIQKHRHKRVRSDGYSLFMVPNDH